MPLTTPKLLVDEGIPVLDRVTVDSTLSAYSAVVAYSIFLDPFVTKQRKLCLTPGNETHFLSVFCPPTPKCVLHTV